MKNIKLTEEEIEVLGDIFEHYISDLRMEIADTDSKDFRDKLKHKKELLFRIQEALKTTEEIVEEE